MDTAAEVELITWPMSECYGEGWGDLIVPEAFAHPAKFSRMLIFRIVRFMLERGMVQPGQLVGDPFGGVALGGLACTYSGLRWLGVELEERFATLAQANIDLHRRELGLLGCPLPVLVQGDSRRFSEIVRDAAAVVTSPPFAESLATNVHTIGFKEVVGNCHRKAGHTSPSEVKQDYGTTPGQVGALRAGDVQDVLQAVVTSPPFLASEGGCKPSASGPAGDPALMARHNATQNERYGTSAGNVANLPPGDVDAVVTSPGYGGSEISDNRKTVNQTIQGNGRKDGKKRGATIANTIGGYADPDNVSAASGGTYWSAMRDIYAQCLAALKPGGWLACVVKGYVSKGKLVDLPGQTAALLTHLGFVVEVEVHAMLTSEVEVPDLFGGTVKEGTSRKSFFRRLAERKGSPAIDYETVLFARKPEGQGQEGVVEACVTSPPYAATNNQGGDQATHPGMKWANGERTDRGKVDRGNFKGTDYGTTPGQVGSLKPGNLGDVLKGD